MEAKAENQERVFIVPPFDAGSTGKNHPRAGYWWWGWHPNYPYWSRSCWGGATEAEAREAFQGDAACGMDVYHNKLIREWEYTYTEIEDVPCERQDVWQRVYNGTPVGKPIK